MANSSMGAGLESPSLNTVQIQIFENKGNLTALKTILAPAFVDSSEFRGTLTILWSCIVTLIACIYTALHLNVPGDTGKFHALATKGKWVLIGLLAPEVVLYLACSQFIEARRLALELNRIASQASEQKEDNSAPFDIKYGFFVVMGGLEVSVKDIVGSDGRESWDSYSRGTIQSGRLRLTPNGVLQLASLGHLIHIPRSRIDDKSKADVLQKCLVVMQVIWMATQCIVRKIYGLPLSLLEVHTMVHVFCALLMFLFWMKKPLDMRDPEVVNSNGFEDVIALMVQEQFHDRMGDDLIIYPRRGYDPRIRPVAVKWIHIDNSTRLLLRDDLELVQSVEWVSTDDFPVELTVGHALDSGISVVARSHTFEVQRNRQLVVRPGYEYLPTDDNERYELVTWEIEPSLPSRTLHKPDTTRLERLVSAIERIDGPVQEAQLLHPKHRQPRFPREHFHEAFSRAAGNFQYTGESQMDPDDMVRFIFGNNILLLLLLVLPAVYGAIHYIVVNFDFPSAIERTLWRIASIDIMVTMPLFFLLTWLGFFVSRCFHDDYSDDADCCCSISYKLPGHILLILYILCRLFIVVESFISLRHLPIGVFWTPSWIQMIPHI